MFSIFSKESKNEINRLKNEVQKLSNTLKWKDKYIEKLEEELREVIQQKEQNEKDFKIKQKQIEIFDKNLRHMRNSNNMLKEDKKILKHSALDANLPLEKHKYKIPLERHFSSVRFREFIQTMEEKDILFINDLNDNFINMCEDESKVDEIRKGYEDFSAGNLDLETKIYVLKGEKLTKIFAKNRKFTTYTSKNGFEYIDEIADFDFSKLEEEGFKPDQISELVEKSQSYYDKFLIV